jgi:hypothetical protein
MTTSGVACERVQARQLTAQEETVTLSVFLAPMSKPVLPRRLSESRHEARLVSNML